MIEKFLEIMQCHVPKEFPDEAFSHFLNLGKKAISMEPEDLARPLLQEFGCATNIIPWRFRSGFEFKSEFVQSWEIIGNAADHNEIYKREKSFFGWLNAEVSAIDASFHAIYVLCALKQNFNLDFSEKARRNISPKKLADQIPENVPSYLLKKSIVDVINSKEYGSVKELRNRMSHRGNIPRHIKVTPGSGPDLEFLNYAATWSSAALVGDSSKIDEMMNWFASTMKSILEAGHDIKRTQ